MAAFSLRKEQEEYISSILSLKTPYQIPKINDKNDHDDVQHLLFHADYLWNVGDTEEALKLISTQIQNHDDYDENKHGSFLGGVESLCKGSLQEALKEFRQAATTTNNDILKVFFTERSVNIAFWLACSGQMVDAAQILKDQVDATPFAGGVLSFAIHMAGDSISAEKVARTAIAHGFDDPWTIHAIAHALTSQGRVKECATWLETNREKFINCNAFMKGHIEFHLALCFVDMEDGPILSKLIDTNLWGTMSNEMKDDYWNAAGLLNAMWKAELRGVATLSSHDQYIDNALRRLTSILSGVNKSKSLVFSLCIFRYSSGDIREKWKNALLTPEDPTSTDDDSENTAETILAAVATAISLVYHSEDIDSNDDDETNTSSRWEKAERVLAPIATKLDKLGASPEQREVLEDFVGVVGRHSRSSPSSSCSNNENVIIDLASWYDRNQRPGIPFYDRIIEGGE